uniref:Uncharacterized protein n=1 Tax=viral metagenome TaxID=1070528 RepID=A0A6C0DHH4_9ZZZZ
MEIQNISVIIVEKNGSLKSLTIKEYKEDELYKKCGFKKAEDFVKQTEWSNIKIEGKKYVVVLYGKTEGKANTENKYDFPPPVDSTLFFGNCVLVAHVKKDNSEYTLTNLTIELWNKIYEKLFGGFEDLAVTCAEDENEVDELEGVPAEKKTKHGYLKDGFVVDSDEDEEYGSDDDDDDSDDLEQSDDVEESDDVDEELELEDIGSELSEEEYDYSDDGGDEGGVSTVFTSVNTNTNTKKKKD